jgi:hypothetical protein
MIKIVCAHFDGLLNPEQDGSLVTVVTGMTLPTMGPMGLLSNNMACVCPYDGIETVGGMLCTMPLRALADRKAVYNIVSCDSNKECKDANNIAVAHNVVISSCSDLSCDCCKSALDHLFLELDSLHNPTPELHPVELPLVSMHNGILPKSTSMPYTIPARSVPGILLN